MASSHIKLTIDSSELDRLAIGGRIYDKLDLGNMHNILKVDNEEIAICEEDIIDIFNLVNSDYKKQVKIIKRR